MGPSIATDILINSDLKIYFDIYHINTNTHTKISGLGKIHVLSIIRNVSIYYKYFLNVYKHQPDLILIPISQTTLGFLKDSIFIIIAKLFKIKFIVQLRGSNWNNWLKDCYKFVRFYVQTIMRMANGGILLSNKLKYLFEDYYDPNLIFCISNGLNVKNITKRKNNKNEKLKLLYVGNFIPGKGIFDIIQALNFLNSESTKEISLICAGNWIDQTSKRKYINFVKKNNLPVVFKNNIYGAEKYSLFEEASIFLFTPRDPEGHPWVIVEALAYSLPIISTDKGAISDCVFDNKNGFIVKSRTPTEIAKKIKILIRDRKMRTKMGEYSKKVYEEKFTEKIMIDNYVKTFKKLIS
jgi:glycosyltransferase involved in cell wall biosynthesis